MQYKSLNSYFNTMTHEDKIRQLIRKDDDFQVSSLTHFDISYHTQLFEMPLKIILITMKRWNIEYYLDIKTTFQF